MGLLSAQNSVPQLLTFSRKPENKYTFLGFSLDLNPVIYMWPILLWWHITMWY